MLLGLLKLQMMGYRLFLYKVKCNTEQNQLLVFPTSRKVREYINSKKELNTLLPTIITIDEFFKKSIYFENKKYIDEDERFLYLNEATKSIDLNILGISKSFTQFLKQSEYIYRFFLELSSENIGVETIQLVLIPTHFIKNI
ncbi:MAG: hypothetical protein ACNI22_16745 [Halarcobacter sp.]